MLITYVLLAISTSIDSIGIGITYGLRNIMISKNAKLILFFISLFISIFAIIIGHIASQILPVEYSNIIGSIILFFMGIAILINIFKEKRKLNNNNEDKEQVSNSIKTKQTNVVKKQKVYRFFIKWLGITIEIIKDPSVSDLDSSKKIDGKEAIYLGIALSLDAFSIGIGTGMIGLSSYVFPFLVALFQVFFLSIGRNIGIKIQKISCIPTYFWNLLAAILLIIIGVFRLSQ